VALIAAHAAIAIVAVSLIEYLVFGRVNPWLPMAFLVGAVVGVVSLKDAAFGPAATPRAAGPGQVVAAREEPALWALIRDVAARVGTDPPDQIIVGLAPQFFVTEVEVVTPAGPLRGRTLYCSLALLRILSVDELRAVVGHELAHFHGADTTFSSRIYPTYHATEAAIRTLIVQGGRGIRQAITRPAILALASFAEAMGEAERAFSRDRELAADAVGAAVTSAAAMASALAKVDAYNDVWLEVRTLVAASNASGPPVSNIAATFADVVRRRAAEAALALPLESHVTHPTDTHPPTAMRLSALGIAVERACADARAVTPDPPAASLITTAVSRELALSATALSRPQKT
jgi:Zn-dependent protease with chaperone function